MTEPRRTAGPDSFSADATAIIRVEEPAMPAPAGASESVSISTPVSGAKYRIRCARRGSLYFADARRWSRESNVSVSFRSREEKTSFASGRVRIVQLAYRLTAKFTVTAPS